MGYTVIYNGIRNFYWVIRGGVCLFFGLFAVGLVPYPPIYHPVFILFMSVLLSVLSSVHSPFSPFLCPFGRWFRGTKKARKSGRHPGFGKRIVRPPKAAIMLYLHVILASFKPWLNADATSVQPTAPQPAKNGSQMQPNETFCFEQPFYACPLKPSSILQKPAKI